jgi:CHAT domain-containing protein/Tfp pilus assembly protein PilF
MSFSRLALLVAALMPASLALAAARDSVPAVAVVVALDGRATASGHARAVRPLRRFDWLPAGIVVETASGARVVVVYSAGDRFAIKEKTKAVLEKTEPKVVSGEVERLAALPPLPRSVAFDADQAPGVRSGAVRIRTDAGTAIDGLRPARGEATLAESTALRFTPRPGIARYQVEVEDERGATVFEQVVTASVATPGAGALAAGRRYHWRVHALDEPGTTSLGETDFRTLSLDEARARAALAAVARSDAEAFALLAAVDRRLGLARAEAPTASASVNAECGALLAREDWRAAQECHRRALAALPEDGPPSLEAAAHHHGLAAALEMGGDLAGAESEYRRAVDIREVLAPQSRPLAASLDALGNVRLARSDLKGARRFFERAQEVADAGPETVERAVSLQGLGEITLRGGDRDGAETLLRQSLDILERSAPESEALAAVLDSLARVARARGDSAAQERHNRRALELRTKRDPQGLGVATSLNNLGALMNDRGDLQAAEDLFRRALALRRARAPVGLAFAKLLNNLSVVAADRGDLAGAESLLREALALKEAQAPDSPEVAYSLVNLSYAAYRREDLANAETLLKRALALSEKNPRAVDTSLILSNLGDVRKAAGDLAGAEDAVRRALAVQREHEANGLEIAPLLVTLAEITEERGDLAGAEELHRQGLALRESLAPDGADLAHSLHELGKVELARGNVTGALEHQTRALAIWERLAPHSLYEAKALHALGQVHRAAGRADEARTSFCRAIDALEGQTARLGGSEDARLSFGAKYGPYYHECLRALVDAGQAAEALHVLERSRARSLLALLAERDLVFASDAPPEIEAARKALDAEYDRTQAALHELRPAESADEIERLRAALHELQVRREENVARLRQGSPRLASLRHPVPLDLEGIERSLDPGTVWLAYSVGAQETLLFVVEPAGGRGLSVFRRPVDEATLRARVKAFRSLIDRREDTSALRAPARELYDLLLAPAAASLARARRLVISPDGPLHTLPFAALATPRGYLVEGPPLHLAVSATVYAELKKDRREARAAVSGSLTAFGDPVYPPRPDTAAARAPGGAERGIASTRDLAFGPLPGSRREVEQIARLYGTGARTYLGAEATEEHAKGVGREARYLHFACHALIDERFPLDSALALSPPASPAPGRDNGLLQAWEIFEGVRIDADLVTLSACRTGLGAERGGEGLVGLARAFQYAGARTVVASLWGVGDESTADLMTAFYRALRAGASKDEALREAQRRVLHTAATAHPFHWAAFELNGDWR